jgi:hypothetical protein
MLVIFALLSLVSSFSLYNFHLGKYPLLPDGPASGVTLPNLLHEWAHKQPHTLDKDAQ